MNVIDLCINQSFPERSDTSQLLSLTIKCNPIFSLLCFYPKPWLAQTFEIRADWESEVFEISTRTPTRLPNRRPRSKRRCSTSKWPEFATPKCAKSATPCWAGNGALSLSQSETPAEQWLHYLTAAVKICLCTDSEAKYCN